jgi:polyisoprenoid-binding protein YceI
METARRFRFLVLAAIVSALAMAIVPTFARAQSTRSRKKIAARPEDEKSAAQAGQINLKRSAIYVYVDKTGLGHEHGVEGKVKSGAIQLGARADAGSIEFDMTSFSADTDRARKYVGLEGSTSASTRRQVDKNMLGPDVLDVGKYPTATFAVESALRKKTKQGKPVVELKGRFTLHGKSRPLTLDAEPSQTDGQWNLRGDFSIRQSDFGITPYSAALGTVGVADQLRIYGDLWIAGDETTQE